MVLNNRPYPDWHEGLTIRGVMEHMKFTWPKLVVKVNGQLVWPEDYDKVTLEEAFEDLSFTGGRLIQKGDAGLEIDKERYKRNILLPEVGEEGQKKLAESRVLVVGAGGLGSPVSLYLAAAGVGTIGIADFDRVDVSNLQRQILYREQDIGKAKAELAAEQLQRRNHSVQVELYPEGITAENAEEILAKFDVIVDASDNFPTRYLLSDKCMKLGKPDVYGAICEFAGQVTVFASDGP